MAYYPDWAGDDFPPEKIDFSRFDWIDFAFALPTTNATLTWDDPSVPGLLTRLVAAARSSCTEAHCTKVKLSIGGWTDSKYFSTLVGTDQSRKRFVQNIVEAYYQFNVNGIDIDWEYPGIQGAGNNIVSACDSANFLKFLQLLRSVLPPCAKITAATQTVPFAGPDGSPLKDVTAFAEVLDWILLMNYDAWGSSAKPGPNAPLSDKCQNSTQPTANAEAALEAWTSAGFAPSQLVLGVPSYGYLSESKATRLRTRETGVVLNSDGGQIQFRELVRQGALVRLPDGSFNGTGGFTRDFDECSSTPYLWSGHQVVTYDDPESLGLKAAFAKKMGMCGVNMFDVHGDTDGWDLVDAIRRSLL
ncbi:glycoside hydrolase [Mycena olivaceomarginata]|nr:glycoside hydrolase [Mycena olivaceomarginata]